MEKILITFANSEKIILTNEQSVTPIKLYTLKNGTSTTGIAETFTPEVHFHDGLIPSVTELVCSCEFFAVADNPGKFYKTSAIVSIETI